VHASGKDDRLAALLQQFLHIRDLDARRVTRGRFSPIPCMCATGL
jgi:hypothetical protein